MLVGAGAAGSSVDAANILKPALSRGELQVIGATTMDEYRKHIDLMQRWNNVSSLYKWMNLLKKRPFKFSKAFALHTKNIIIW